MVSTAPRIPRPIRIHGELWIPPRPIADVLRCSICREPLEYRSGYWQCPTWRHNGLVSKECLFQRLRPVVKRLRLAAKVRSPAGIRELVERLAVLSAYVQKSPKLLAAVRRSRGSTLATNQILADVPEPLPNDIEKIFRLISKPDKANKYWQDQQSRARDAYLAWAREGGRLSPAKRFLFRAHMRNVLREELDKPRQYRHWAAITACCDLAQQLDVPIDFAIAWDDIEGEIEERRRGEKPPKPGHVKVEAEEDDELDEPTDADLQREEQGVDDDDD